MPDIPSVDLNNPELIAKELYKQNLELHKERRRIEELLYRVSEAIYATDEEGNLTLFNHTLEILLKVNAKDVLGKKVTEVINLTNEKGETLNLDKYSKFDREKIDIPSLAILKTPIKDHYVHIKISIIKTDQGYKERLVTMTDVTLEKELEKAKDEFISITSHELRTPMSIVKSYLWMLQSDKGGELNEKQRKYVEKALSGTERMIALISDMLNVSRIEQGKIEFKKEKIDIREYLEDIREELEMKAKEKNLYLNIEHDANVKTIYADKQKLREVIINLVGNAIKFTDEGGITIKISEDESFTKIIVIDTGRGIAQNEMKHLFRKFERLDNSYQTVAESGGTGLGLYIVKLYMENMYGKVEVASEGEGKGSTFTVSLSKLK